jgi:hypothetical protein
MKRLQRVAWILILIVDVGYIAWVPGPLRRRIASSDPVARRSSRRGTRAIPAGPGRNSRAPPR